MNSRTTQHARMRPARRGRPCPICGRPGWCMANDEAAICMRTPNEHPVDCQGAGIGYLHRLGQGAPAPARRAQASPSDTISPSAPSLPSDDTGPSWASLLHRYAAGTPADGLRHLADSLGVSVASLKRLGFVWAGPHRAWAIPMRDVDGEVCGIRLRAESGQKWAVKGSRAGLFLPDGGELPDQAEEILICEGPTDTAAMLDLGFVTIGRPSCQGLEDQLARLLTRRRVVIVADNDQKTRPDGTPYHPGQEGAARLAQALAQGPITSVKIIYPQDAKDARAWKLAGATADLVRMRIRQARLTLRKER